MAKGICSDACRLKKPTWPNAGPIPVRWKNRVIDLDLVGVRPAADQFVGIFVNRRVSDVGDIGERRQRLSGAFLVAQIDRDEVEVPPAWQRRLAPGQADD